MANINARVREIDFVSRFQNNVEALMQIFDITRPIRKEPGTRLTAYNASVTLQSGNVPEGDEIPYSLASVTEVAHKDVEVLKWAKGVTLESVNKYGAEVAIAKTDDALLEELQGAVIQDMYNFAMTGTLKSTETDFQMGVAMAIGMARDAFKKMRKSYDTVACFVNTLDAYRYLGSANISIQSAFGIDYVENFMGSDRLLISSEIPQGKIIATPVENIDLYYVDPSDSDFARMGLEYTTVGDTPLIGFHVNGNYSHAVGETFAIMGMTLWAEYLNGIAVVTVGATTPNVTLNATTASVAVGSTVALTATTVPANATVTWASDDESIATVAAGTVTGVAEGVATITGTITVGGVNYPAACEVTVTKA